MRSVQISNQQPHARPADLVWPMAHSARCRSATVSAHPPTVHTDHLQQATPPSSSCTGRPPASSSSPPAEPWPARTHILSPSIILSPAIAFSPRLARPASLSQPAGLTRDVQLHQIDEWRPLPLFLACSLWLGASSGGLSSGEGFNVSSLFGRTPLSIRLFSVCSPEWLRRLVCPIG